jgi:hypothetical protein
MLEDIVAMNEEVVSHLIVWQRVLLFDISGEVPTSAKHPTYFLRHMHDTAAHFRTGNCRH